MTPHAIKLLTYHPLRLALTIGGVALCLVLMLFLLSIYAGVADGSVEYIRQSKADLWVLQGNATNILRGTSILSTAHGNVLRSIKGVRLASPVLLSLTSIKKDGQLATIFLTGFDPVSSLGGPPSIIDGRTIMSDSEIVLDRSFAKKFGFAVGDTVVLKDGPLRVVGLSGGTNAFVIQYAFASIHRVQTNIGFPSLVTCYLITLEQGARTNDVSAAIRDELPGVEVFDHSTFLQNNMHEMESGVLPLLYTIAAIGAVVLTVILSLLLSISILERRKDFAVLKAVGAPQWFLPRLITGQALLITTAASAASLMMFHPLVVLIETLTPEISIQPSVNHVVVVAGAAVLLGLVSSFLSAERLRCIYLLEAFT